MGKKSLTKSTTKKKSAPKKKTPAKNEEVKAAPEKKAAPKTKATPKKTAAEKPTLKSLLKKDFGSWTPENLFAVLPDEDYVNNFTAPPAIDESDKAKAKEIKALLAKQFDLNAVEKPVKEAAPKQAETKKAAPIKEKKPAAEKKEKPAPKKAAPAKKEIVPIPELLKLKFDSWQPEKMYTPKPDEAFLKGFTAPPVIETTDKAQAGKIKALLAKTFDLTVSEPVVPPAAEAEKAAVEKAEAKAKTEKDAAEKAKAEKEAEEKAKAEAEAEAEAKAKAEKAKAEAEAAEKAKAEKEAKAKAEKVKADKAKAEKEAAEKARAAAAAKLKAEKTPAPPVMPTVTVPTEPPMNSAVKTLIALVAGFFGLMIIASAMNTNNYYLKPADNAVEIWQGKFSPTGEKLVISVPGATIKKPVKSVYEKKEALVPAFDYYMGKAEALSKVRGTLDFDSIKSNLYKAIKFAPSIHHKKEAKTQLTRIDFMFLVHQTDSAASKNTVEGFDAALKNLSKAAVLGTEKDQRELLDKKTAEINEKLSALKDKIKALKPAVTIEKPAAAPPVTKKSHSEKTKAAEPAKRH